MKTWLTLTGAETQHLVIGGRLDSRLSARCGRTPLWFAPRGWIEAKAGQRRCGTCARLDSEDE